MDSNEKNLKVKNSLLELDGVIGRSHYFINSAILIATFIMSFIPTAITRAGLIITVPCCIGLFILGMANQFKRLRDVRGTTENQILFQVILTVFLVIPYINAIPNIFLLFMEGAVTGSGKGLGELEKSVNSMIKAGNPVAPTANLADKQELQLAHIEAIEKLHKLKESGAITDEEFSRYKFEALKKVA